MKEVPIKTLLQCLDYDYRTGALKWKSRPQDHFRTEAEWKRWITRYAGKPAFTFKNRHGYLVGTLNRQWFSAHRVCWALHYGKWAEGILDHENHIKTDNRIANLAVSNHSLNGRNQNRSSNNTSGHCGVTWQKRSQRWTASITGENRRQISLGEFRQKEDAIAARKAAEFKYGYHVNHGMSALIQQELIP